MHHTNTQVDEYFDNLDRWLPELRRLRSIVLGFPLVEEYKWRQPCYVYEKSNVAILSGAGEYCALGFFKGVLLQDPRGLLVAPGPNSQSSRLIKVTSMAQIEELESDIKALIQEAIEVERAGRTVEYKEASDYAVPEELTDAFDESPEFKTAFEALTPGRQKGYLLHFSGAKQSKTRAARIERYRQRIMDGKGMQDCVCGLSKRFPTCDGSHKQLDAYRE